MGALVGTLGYQVHKLLCHHEKKQKNRNTKGSRQFEFTSTQGAKFLTFHTVRNHSSVIKGNK